VSQPHDATVKYSEEVTEDQLGKLSESMAFSIEDGRDHVHWACPRCHAEFDQSFDRDQPVYGFDVETLDIPEEEGVIELLCECGVKHEGGDGKPGCGFAARQAVRPS
jgi:hypothetical protein